MIISNAINAKFTEDIGGIDFFILMDTTRDLSIQVTGLRGLKSRNYEFRIHGNGDCRDLGSHFNPEMVNCLRLIFIQKVFSCKNVITID